VENQRRRAQGGTGAVGFASAGCAAGLACMSARTWRPRVVWGHIQGAGALTGHQRPEAVRAVAGRLEQNVACAAGKAEPFATIVMLLLVLISVLSPTAQPSSLGTPWSRARSPPQWPQSFASRSEVRHSRPARRPAAHTRHGSRTAWNLQILYPRLERLLVARGAPFAAPRPAPRQRANH